MSSALPSHEYGMLRTVSARINPTVSAPTKAACLKSIHVAARVLPECRTLMTFAHPFIGGEYRIIRFGYEIFFI